MGRIFVESAINIAEEQGFDKFETIRLLAMRAKQKSNAVIGTKYLTEETRAWAKLQSKFTVQAIRELIDGELNLIEFHNSLAHPIQEDNTLDPLTEKTIENKPKE